MASANDGNRQTTDARAILDRIIGDDPELRRLVDAETQLAKLREALAEGLAQAERGELVDGPEAIAEIRDSLHKPRLGDMGSE